MPPSSDDKSGKDPLEHVLRDVEADLRNRLRDACEAEASGISTDSTLEIRRLEDALLGAAAAAGQTIALRRQIEQRKSETSQRETSAASSDAPADAVFSVREFRDAEGHRWRAWPVTPGPSRLGRTSERYLGEFHKGWICFEALDSSARRRLPTQPVHWADLKESELCQLLEQAINAPQRTRRTEGGGQPSRPSVQ